MKRIFYILFCLLSATGSWAQLVPGTAGILYSGRSSFTFRASASASTNSPGTNALGTVVNTTNSNFAVAVITDFSSVALGSVTDSRGNTWTLAKSQATGGSASRTSIYYSNLVSLGFTTITYTTAASNNMCNIFVYTFSTTGTVSVDQTNGANGTSSTSPQPGSVTPTGSNSLVITGLAINPITTIGSINQGFTLSTTYASALYHVGGAAAYLMQGGAAAVNPTWTTTGSPTTSSAAIVVFKQ